ncbi:Zinc carboxypeptidase [Tenacibaculum sp. MAR_2009_124]|uniref:M14 family metallopeptidase n=1 Tax=Tenacibaculum sp. MAR_2009_124 TaxID=1250059 RepID=UPI00089BB7A6|nr:M14 family metallopeptidase [Tenacibaculum sp. MAR_2009_124]SEB80661.1 Zinc carboxypeptidase [Tenacibaculum sp. MAR_2009_124]
MKKILLLLVLAIGANTQGQVSLNYYLPKNVTYNKNIPVPASVIDHEIGEWHITHDKLVNYMKELAKSSDRISIENRGETFEGRPLLLLTITSANNHTRIDEIRKKHIELTDNESLDVSNEPIVVYQGFSIHGNEASGANAALALAYYLAAAEGKEIESLLKNTVVLLDPAMNPDGLQRFAYWANTNKASNINPDPNDREYHEIWPGGRTNHYWFDMNRDWLPVQLPESTARVKTFHDWLPNILTDHHEMGTNSTFFFQPGIPERTNPLTPELNQELTKEIGKYHAKALDKIGSLYYSEEDFDDFYYGKGSTFPDVNGSIGILFEQGSSRGHAQESENGLLTFPFTIRNQFTASLSTLEAAHKMRAKILNYQQSFYKKSRSLYENKAIVFGDEKDAGKSYELAKVLKKHRVKLHSIKNDFEANGKKFKKNYSYAIPLNQKNNRLVQAMFDTRKKFKDSLFYDVSAWTFDAAFGVDLVRNVSLSKVGEEIKDLHKNIGRVTNNSHVGYLMPWNEYYTPKALNKILEKGLRAKVAMKNFNNDGNSYDYGTIFIPVQNQKLNQTELYSFLNEVARESKLSIFGVSTGQNIGIDLGSRNFRAVKKPKVAMLVGNGITSYDAGEIWHMLDQRFDMKLTKLDTDYLGRANIDKYTTIIVPNSYGLNADVKNKLSKWVKNGGVLIGYRNAIRWFKNASLLNVDVTSTKIDEVKKVSFEDRSLHSGAQVIGGAIFKAKIDRSHPINFGYKDSQISLFRNTTLFIKPDKKSYNNPIQYTESPLLSGYVSEKNLENLKNTVPFKVQRLGAGRVLGFTDNTNFRGFWFGTNKLLMNAIFFGKLM